ncbi:MAG: protein kinase [Myxococcales bacterium]|nr:protein kinase [Myxococcales bacterium]
MSSRVGDETIRQFGVSARADPLVGSTVDSYLVEAQVGAGAMGIVYRGVHNVIGKTVAIKVLKPDYADDPDMVQRLIREARTVNAIRHPGIVDIFGFGTLPKTGQPYIVMDLLVGEPLDAFITREAPVPVRTAGPILEELLSALHAAHQVGVVHRDLKPGNVFLEALPEGGYKLKVIDFGLARQADRAGGSIRPTNPGTLIGTPAFMAPEQVMGLKLTPATDLYAVGGIAYQLLTGHLPHEAPNAIEVLSQKMAHDSIRPKQWNPKLSDELDAWVMSLLAREVPDRLGDADEARRRLRRLLDTRTQSGPQAVGPVPVRASAGAGVMPKRDWGEAKTMVGEPVYGPAAEVSTEDHYSPFAQTQGALPIPQVTPPRPTEPYGLPVPDALRRTSPVPVPAPPKDVTDSTLKPGQVLARGGGDTQLPPAATPTGPFYPRPQAAPPQPEDLALPPSRLPLILALIGTIAALLVGLWWLFSQR